MGKRELLLVFGFVIVGVVVYQATARPAAPGERGLSISRLLQEARRELRGNRINADETTTATHELTPDVNELRVVGNIAEIEVSGESRQNIESVAHVESNGYDEAEAREYVKQTKLTVDRTASSIILRMDYPRGGRQRATLKVKVPSRLLVRVEPGSGGVRITNVAGVELAGSRGDAALTKILGRVEISHRGGEVEIQDVGSLEFTGRAGSLKVSTVGGDASIRMEQGGELTASGISGALEVDGRNCDITLEDLSTTRGPVRLNVIGGSLKVKGLKADTRIDGREAEIEVAMAAPAPLAIYTYGERVSLSPPAAGYTLDARITEGRVTPDDFVASMGFSSNAGGDNKDARVFGPYKGGGPTISVRATNADFTIRAQDDKPAGTPPATPAKVEPKLESTLK
jgi:hypothetical protein